MAIRKKKGSKSKGRAVRRKASPKVRVGKTARGFRKRSTKAKPARRRY